MQVDKHRLIREEMRVANKRNRPHKNNILRQAPAHGDPWWKRLVEIAAGASLIVLVFGAGTAWQRSQDETGAQGVTIEQIVTEVAAIRELIAVRGTAQVTPSATPSPGGFGDGGTIVGRVGIIGDEYATKPMYCSSYPGNPSSYDPQSFVIALVSPLFSGSSLCGREVTVTVQHSDGKVATVTVRVEDSFPATGIDLRSQAANKFNVSPAAARVLGIHGLEDATLTISAD